MPRGVRMQRTLGLIAFLAVSFVLPLPSAAGDTDSSRPYLELRTATRAAFTPVEVTFIGRLVGGDDVEDFHCPAFEWDWGDGARSVRESDCDAFDTETRLLRVFSRTHRYRTAGEFIVRLTLRQAGRVVALATTELRLVGPTGAPLASAGRQWGEGPR